MIEVSIDVDHVQVLKCNVTTYGESSKRQLNLGDTRTKEPRLKVRWPSGLRRQLKALVRKGVGSNPTLIILFPAIIFSV